MSSSSKTIYGCSIPPGISSSTRGQLKVRVDRVVLDHEAVSVITGDAARKVVETPFVSFHFWGGEDKPSPVVQPSSLVNRPGTFNLVFPVKTSKSQLDTYFKHMSMAKSGLEIRVLMHSIRGAVTLAETSSATIGRTVINLDEMTQNHPMAGWFSVVTLPEDAGTYPPSPNPTVLGRMKLCITLEHFAQDPVETGVVVMAPSSSSEAQQQQQGGETAGNAKPSSSSKSKHAAATSSCNTRKKGSEDNICSPEKSGGDGDELVVVGHALSLPEESDGTSGGDKSAKQLDTASGSRPGSKPPVPRTSAAAQKKTASSVTDTTDSSSADKLLAAGLKLRQQLAAAAGCSTVDDVIQQSKHHHHHHDGGDGGGPYAPLTLGVAPHTDQEISHNRNNRLQDSESDREDIMFEQQYHRMSDLAGFPFHTINSNTAVTGGNPKPKKVKSRKGESVPSRHPSRGNEPLPNMNAPPPHHHDHAQPPQHQHPEPDQHHHHHPQRRPAPRPHQHSGEEQQEQEQSGGEEYVGLAAGGQPGSYQQQQQSPPGTPLVGSFVVRVCVGQLALQTSCGAIKLVARLSPDVLFTTPPEMGCFVSPDIELPIADDDVVGFNVTGVRRLTSTSRVVLELYAKPVEAASEFTLVGLTMAPICGSAASGVLRNVVLRNPLNAGSIHAQCDVYVSFFQDPSAVQVATAQQQYQQQQQQQQSEAPLSRPFGAAASHQDHQQTQQHVPAASSSSEATTGRSASSSSAPPQHGNSDSLAATAPQQQQHPSSSAMQSHHANTTTTLVRHSHVQPTATASAAASSNEDGATSSTGARLSIEILEAKNLRPIRDGELVSAPTCYAVIDDVLLLPASANKKSVISMASSSALSSSSRPTTPRSSVIETAANWQTLGPDATHVAVAELAPRFGFSSEIAVDVDSPSHVSRVCISVHHCRNQKLAESFVNNQHITTTSSNAAAAAAAATREKQYCGLYLDPEQNRSVVDLLQSSVELGVISLSARCLGSMPFDGWAHAMDEVTGESVGQFRVRCSLKPTS